MSEYDRLEKLAKELREKYPPGTRIELNHMEDEFAPVEEGTRGTVHFIDDIGQIHMLWDNGRTLPINTETDTFRALSEEEYQEEVSERLNARYYDALNKDILPHVDWDVLGKAYKERDMDCIKSLLQKMHNAFVEVYGTDMLTRDMGFVSVPGVVVGANSTICLALLDLDTMSSGEHWGTTYLTPNGVYQPEQQCHPLAEKYARAMTSYEYWYTMGFLTDHHVDFDKCPKDIINMIADVVNDCPKQNGGITY